MNAALWEDISVRPMRTADIDAVMAVERDVYPFPWTAGNFRDSIRAGYSCWVCEIGVCLIGYGVMMVGAGEAHLLNLSVSRAWQGKGVGRRLLLHFMNVAREGGAAVMLLEVRPSNTAARRLYLRSGFREIGVRKNYYPAEKGREDALVMERAL